MAVQAGSSQRVTTKAKVSLDEFEEHKVQFLFDTKEIIKMEDIPDSLVINWDHTGIHYVQDGAWTMKKEDSKRVAITGTNDKRQIAAVFSITMAGHYLPPQIIGKNKEVFACSQVSSQLEHHFYRES